MAFVLLVGISTALVAATAITYRLSLLMSLGAFYCVLAICQIAYLAFVVAQEPEGASERSMAGRVPPRFR
ncbi:hypothetical protein [Methylobacterium marchantiae]|uniref:Exopolysaccharide production repressor exox n=1 Tax=Methylobacterium marchantiae TaxID=600331 RepID=A0ABW3X648_9HYPH|nr:hypothetical protein AIGOOFII_1987 [Methylobacterium marchantiae]